MDNKAPPGWSGANAGSTGRWGGLEGWPPVSILGSRFNLARNSVTLSFFGDAISFGDDEIGKPPATQWGHSIPILMRVKPLGGQGGNDRGSSSRGVLQGQKKEGGAEAREICERGRRSTACCNIAESQSRRGVCDEQRGKPREFCLCAARTERLVQRARLCAESGEQGYDARGTCAVCI
jgi:hypothetical protein